MNRRMFVKGLATLAVIPNALMVGVAQAKAARKPLMFGKVLNSPVIGANERILEYYVGEGVVSIEAVRDGGMELVIDGDVPLFELVRADVLPGHVLTCIKYGAFRLGGLPAFPVTIDATGYYLRSRVTRMDELAGAVRSGECSREWRDEIDAQGLLVHTW